MREGAEAKVDKIRDNCLTKALQARWKEEREGCTEPRLTAHESVAAHMLLTCYLCAAAADTKRCLTAPFVT